MNNTTTGTSNYIGTGTVHIECTKPLNKFEKWLFGIIDKLINNIKKIKR